MGGARRTTELLRDRAAATNHPDPRHDGAEHVDARRGARTCYDSRVRTTVEFDDDTAKAVEQMRRELGVGVSEAVNVLIRRGLLPRGESPPFRQRTRRLGVRIDVSNVAGALEDLEGTDAR